MSLPLSQLPSLGSRVSDVVKVFPRLMPDVVSYEFTTYQTRPSMLDEVNSLVKPGFVRFAELTGGRPLADPDRRIGWLDIFLEPFPEEAFERVIALALRHRLSPSGF